MNKPRPRPTPEQLRANIERVKVLKEKKAAFEKKNTAISRVKNGRLIIFIIAGLIAISTGVEYSQIKSLLVFLIYAPILGAFVVFGILYYNNPFLFSILALSVYGLLILVGAFIDPSSIYKGIIIKVIIIVGLVRAVKYGRDYREEKKRIVDPNVLDSDLVEG